MKLFPAIPASVPLSQFQEESLPDLTLLDTNHDGSIDFKNEYLPLENEETSSDSLSALRRYFFAGTPKDIVMSHVKQEDGFIDITLKSFSSLTVYRLRFPENPESNHDGTGLVYVDENPQIESVESQLKELYPTMIEWLRGIVERNTHVENKEGILESIKIIEDAYETLGFSTRLIEPKEAYHSIHCLPDGTVEEKEIPLGPHLHAWRDGAKNPLPLIDARHKSWKSQINVLAVAHMDTNYPLIDVSEGGYYRMIPQLHSNKSRLHNDFEQWRLDGKISPEDRFRYGISEKISVDALTPYQVRRYFGPGISSSKGGLVSQIFALFTLANLGFLDEWNIDLFINSDFTLGSPDSKTYLGALARESSACFVFDRHPEYPIAVKKEGGPISIFSRQPRFTSRPPKGSRTQTPLDRCQTILSSLQERLPTQEIDMDVSKVLATHNCFEIDLTVQYQDPLKKTDIKSILYDLTNEQPIQVTLQLDSPYEGCPTLSIIGPEGGGGYSRQELTEYIETPSLITASVQWAYILMKMAQARY